MRLPAGPLRGADGSPRHFKSFTTATVPRMSLHDPFTTPRSRGLVNPPGPVGRGWRLPGRGNGVLMGVSAATAAASVALVATTPATAAYGFAVFVVFTLLAGLVAARLPAGHPHDRFGWANGVTLTRAALLTLLAGGLVQPGLFAGPEASLWLWGAVGLAATALALDGVDGWLARRQGTGSAFGARFDMEVDAGLSLALAGLIFVSGLAGAWVLTIGAARYLFVVGTVFRPAWRRPLRPSFQRKTVCVVQIAGLMAALTPILPVDWRSPLLAATAAAVAFSFLRDVVWLERMDRELPWTDGRPTLAAMLGLARSLIVYRGQPWRTRALDGLYRKLIPTGSLCFDIGAHVGNRTLAMRRRGGTVVALEPQGLLHATLRRILPTARIVLRREAVADRPGTVELAVSSRHPTVTTAASDWRAAMAETPGFSRVAWDRVERVPATTLDRLIDEFGRPYFVKIDVEGLEPAILAGLSTPVPLIAFEFVPGAAASTQACLDRLATLGSYRFNLTFGESQRLHWPGWRDADAVRDAVAALPPGSPSGDIYARLEDA